MLLTAAVFCSSGGQAIPAEFAKGLDDLMDQRAYMNLQLLLIKDSPPSPALSPHRMAVAPARGQWVMERCVTHSHSCTLPVTRGRMAFCPLPVVLMWQSLSLSQTQLWEKFPWWVLTETSQTI